LDGNKTSPSMGDLNLEIDLNIKETPYENVKNVVKRGITRRIVDLKVLREGRDVMTFLPQKGIPLQRKEGMYTCLHTMHM
jgi:hypothetical protein